MANEIQFNFSVQVRNGFFTDQYNPGVIQITQSAVGCGGYVQAIGTSEEVVSFGDITTNGWCRIRNLDTTNYVVYGPEATGAMVTFGKLEPGELAWFRVAPTVVMRAQADTADVKLEVRIYED